MIGEVIAIGDELTSGQRLDTNSQWLSQRLTEIGIRVVYHCTVADDFEANVAVFRTAIARADIVVATGGLGPTADDLTRDTLAAATGVELVQDAQALAHIRNLFESRGRRMPARNSVQAFFPAGSRQIFNACGTAPGIAMSIERAGREPTQLFALPGVPSEMRSMWHDDVAPAILKTQSTRRVIRHRSIKCFGAGESQIEEMLGDIIRRGREPLVGITASSATITLRVTATGDDDATCLAAMEPTVNIIKSTLGVLVIGEGDDELQHAVTKLLLERGMTMASAETPRGGLIAQWMREVPRAEVCFLGSTCADFAVVETNQMAVAARMNASADFGLAVSDVFSPDGQTGVTMVKIALSTSDHVREKVYPVFGDAELARMRNGKLALDVLRKTLLRQ